MEKFWEYIRGVDRGTIIFNPVIFLQIMKEAGIEIPTEEPVENASNET